AARDLRWLFQSDVLAAVHDLAAGGNQELGEQVEESRLAGAIGADQRVDLTTAHPQVDVAHRDEATELLGQVARFEDETVSCALRRGGHGGFPTRFSFWAAACGDSAGPWFRPLGSGPQSIGSGDTGSSAVNLAQAEGHEDAISPGGRAPQAAGPLSYQCSSIGRPSWATSKSCMSLACSSSTTNILSSSVRDPGSCSAKKRISSR